MTTHNELARHIETIRKGGKLSPHARDQVNRILRWALAHWAKFEPELHEWLYPAEPSNKKAPPERG